MVLKLLPFFLSVIPVGAISFAVYQILKRKAEAVDMLKETSPWQHRATVAGIGFILTAVFQMAGGDAGCIEGVNCLHNLTQDKVEFVVKWLLSAGTAHLLHEVKKLK